MLKFAPFMFNITMSLYIYHRAIIEPLLIFSRPFLLQAINFTTKLRILTLFFTDVILPKMLNKMEDTFIYLLSSKLRGGTHPNVVHS